MGTLLVAFVTNHRKAGFFVFRRPTEGWEYIMNLVAALLAVACLGPGQWSLDNAINFAPHGWWALVIALVVGVGGAAATLVDVLAPARAEARRELTLARQARAARSCSTRSGTHLAPVADDADVGRVEDRRVGSALIASTVPAARTPTVWLNLPLAPMLTNRRGAIDRPVMPIWRDAGEPALVGDLAGRAELARRAACAAVRARRTRRARTPMPTPMTVCASASTSRSSSRVRASTRTRPRGSSGVAVGDDAAAVRGARGSGSTPARTVAIWTGDEQWIAATSWPPNAGFHATSRSSTRSSSTASPVRPAPSRAATRDATSRPHAVEPVRIAHG